MGSMLGLLGGGSSSKCAADDEACKKAENEAAAKAALEKKAARDKLFKRDEKGNLPKYNEMECSMDGMVDMAKKLMDNIFLLVTLLKETLAYLIPKEMNQSL